ncbi:MAG: DNA polymerase III subunit delta [Gammaproteobacteria bacterium]|nr:DNA polymerase III subunit delta [Gammaproteobacteria bacterium]
MKLRPEQVAAQLQGPVSSLWLIGGAELLLVQEASDQLWQAARAQGCEERLIFHGESGFDWQPVREALQAFSLFATRRLIEVRLEGRLGNDGRDLLQELADNGVDDNVLLIRTGAMDSSWSRTAWVRAFERRGVVVQCWPVSAEALPRWLEGRLREAGFRSESGAAQLLADLVEGNLLAARQEVEKLALLYPPGELSCEQVISAVSSCARYSPFDLSDAVYQGDGARALRILPALREEGIEPPLLLGTLCRDLRLLIGDDGGYLPKSKQQLLAQARRRGSGGLWRRLLVRAAGIDRVIKGVEKGDAWTGLTGLVLAMAGQATAVD